MAQPDVGDDPVYVIVRTIVDMCRSWLLPSLIYLALITWGPASSAAGPPQEEKRQSAHVGGLIYTLSSDKVQYFAFEPLQITLQVHNPTTKAIELPTVLDSGCELRIHKAGTSEKDRGLSQSQWVIQESARIEKISPGKNLKLRPRAFRLGADELCLRPGRWVIEYAYHGAESLPSPRWVSNQVQVECIDQPLDFPQDATGEIRSLVKNLKRTGIRSSRPGWTSVPYDHTMRRLKKLGDAATPALLANVGNYSRQPQIVQLLGDLKVERAVPQLLDALRMQDDPYDSLIIANLAKITGHPQGYRFHRRWFDSDTREDAVQTYQQWWNAPDLRPDAAKDSR